MMNTEYHPLPGAEKDSVLSYRDSSTFDDEVLQEIPSSCQNGATCRRQGLHLLGTLKTRWLWGLHAVLFVANLIFFILVSTIPSSTLHHVRQYSTWSPAQSAVQYDRVIFNTSTKSNRFVGADPEVDKAWREISYDVGDHWIALSDIAKLGSPKTSLKAVHPKTGKEGYRVGIEVFHQLHCINLLRRVTYKDYYEPLGGEFAAGPEALQMHTDHCLEILRLNIQCNADIGLFSFHMEPNDPLAWPDLDSVHVCRNFEKIREWAVENSIGNMEVIE